MKTLKIVSKHLYFYILLLSSSLFLSLNAQELNKYFVEYKGIVVDRSSGNPLVFANILLEGSNVVTVTNGEGEFSIKIPTSVKQNKILVRFMGYRNKYVLLNESPLIKNLIELEPITVHLPEVSVISKDANALVQAVFDKMKENYSDEALKMTAFYRETVRKNRSLASVSEAVVDIHKQAYTSNRNDIVKLYKSRKKTDYNKIDTIVFKLLGGPYSTLYLDVMKYSEFIFTDNIMSNYKFTFDRSTYMDNLLVYVVDFKQTIPDRIPLYEGKLYIDARNMALKSAVFKMNLNDRVEASKLFVLKKPFNAKVYPVEASYRIDYFEKDGKWYFGYSRIELGLRINWRRKLFNTTYYSAIEMAVTGWQKADDENLISRKDRLKTNVVINDEASGFSDPEFWGEFNIIEPEKPIETAIKKIQKQLEKKD